MNIPYKADCPLCKITRHEQPAIIIQENDDLMAIMDLYPGTSGHILVLPKQHIEDIFSLPVNLASNIMSTATKIARAIKLQLSPDGLNLVQSNKPAAGQTIPHFHLHILPRYEGDSVILRFGHGNEAEKAGELERIASMIRSGLD